MKKVTFTYSCLVLLGVLMVSNLFGQTNVNMPYNTGYQTFTLAPPGTCFFNFYDNGGPAGGYSNSSNNATSGVTFFPSNSATHRVRATFSSFATENGFDWMFIYNGPNTASPLIGQFQGGNSPGTVTGTGATGALTFTFFSDAIINAAGWAAVVAQLPINPCQMITTPVTVSTGAANCLADAVVALPTFNPGGCAAALTFSYQVGGGTPVVVPQPLPPTITIPGLTSGVHTVTYRLVDPCGGALVSSATQQITVQDQVPPVITCPSDIILTLDAGECSAFVGWTIEVTDNCPFLVPVVYTQNPPSYNPAQPIDAANSLNCTFNFTKFGRVFGGPTQPPFNMEGIQCGIRAPGLLGPNNFTFNVYVLTSGTAPAAGNANMQLVGGPFNMLMPPVVTTYVPVVFPAPVSIPAGSYFFVEIIDPNGDFTMGNILLPDVPGTPSYFASAPCAIPNYQTFAATGFNFISLAFNVFGQEGGDATPIQTAGLPSGSEFPIGTTTNCFEVADVAGNTATCCFDVTINEFPNPTTTLACNDNVQVSVNEDCEALITADMILEGGPYRCYDNYVVTIEGINGNLITSSSIGETLTVTVTDPVTGNSCWGTISIEDKIPPVIECRDVTIICGEALPTEPAPPVQGPQGFTYSGLNDPIDNINFPTQEYFFDLSYLPPGTPTLDVDVEIDLTHTWTGDVDVFVTAPSGFDQAVFQVGGCAGTFPIDAWFDDEGVNPVDCNGINANEGHIWPIVNSVPGPNLFNLDGEDASGVWTVRLEDFVGGDMGTIFEVGLAVEVDLPAVDPTDNCGEVELSFTDDEFGDPCEGLTIIRHWTATDESGNTATCDQTITVLPLVIDSVQCPPAYVGSCQEGDEDIHPDETGWPTVNGK